jgi:hypothetical protein
MPDFHAQRSGATAHRFAPAAPNEDTVYGACCPGWHSAASHEDSLADWVEFMRHNDVERVCCLLPGRQLAGSQSNIARYRAVFGDDGVCHAPTPDHHLVDEPLLADRILPFLEDAVATDERVVVHCLAGLGRTGQVLAAWLAHDREMGPDRAVATVEEMGRHPRDAVNAGNATEDDLRALVSTFE